MVRRFVIRRLHAVNLNLDRNQDLNRDLNLDLDLDPNVNLELNINLNLNLDLNQNLDLKVNLKPSPLQSTPESAVGLSLKTRYNVIIPLCWIFRANGKVGFRADVSVSQALRILKLCRDRLSRLTMVHRRSSESFTLLNNSVSLSTFTIRGCGKNFHSQLNASEVSSLLQFSQRSYS